MILFLALRVLPHKFFKIIDMFNILTLRALIFNGKQLALSICGAPLVDLQSILKWKWNVIFLRHCCGLFWFKVLTHFALLHGGTDNATCHCNNVSMNECWRCCHATVKTINYRTLVTIERTKWQNKYRICFSNEIGFLRLIDRNFYVTFFHQSFAVASSREYHIFKM